MMPLKWHSTGRPFPVGSLNRCQRHRRSNLTGARSIGNGRRVHIVGICGTGMTPIALLALRQGFVVTGSDMSVGPTAEMLKSSGIKVQSGHSADLLTSCPVEYVLASSAIKYDNAELVVARAKGILILRRQHWWSLHFRQRLLLAVAGTHGKTSIAALTSYILHQMGVRCPFVVGGDIPQLPVQAMLSSSSQHVQRIQFGALGSVSEDTLVVEADEYGGAFLGLSPLLAIVSNVDHDHVDMFRDQAAMDSAFLAFATRLRSGGVLLLCADDPGCLRLAQRLLDGGFSASSTARSLISGEAMCSTTSQQQPVSESVHLSSETACEIQLTGERVLITYGFREQSDVQLATSMVDFKGRGASADSNAHELSTATGPHAQVPQRLEHDVAHAETRGFDSCEVRLKFHADLFGELGWTARFCSAQPGRHNSRNAAAAVIACALHAAAAPVPTGAVAGVFSGQVNDGEADAALSRFKAALHVACGHVKSFQGVDRRLQRLTPASLPNIGKERLPSACSPEPMMSSRLRTSVDNGPMHVYDDYAHHPTEVAASIAALRRAHPCAELVAVFQPHTLTRAQHFAKRFAQELVVADGVLLLPVYASREVQVGDDSRDMQKRLDAINERLFSALIEARQLVAAPSDRSHCEQDTHPKRAPDAHPFANVAIMSSRMPLEDALATGPTVWQVATLGEACSCLFHWQHAASELVVLCMGAGDISKLAQAVAERYLRQRNAHDCN